MKFALQCPACLHMVKLPGLSEDGSTFDQEAAIDAFTTAHVGHLEGEQTIDVLEVPEVSFFQFPGVRVLN